MSEQTKKSWFARHKILSGILGFFAFIMIVSAIQGPQTSTSPTQTEEQQPEATITITASELYSDYKNNELAADQKYKGKMIEVSGTVASVEEMLGQKFITLNTGDILGKIQCFIDDSEGEKAAELTVGQQITLVGKGDGMSINVVLKQSTIK